MSDGMLDSFWNSLQRAEYRLEAEASDVGRNVYRTIYGYQGRVMRLREALADSGPIARQTVMRKLEGISLDAVWDILFSAVRDMALYYGGSVVLGTAVGAGLGSLAGGVGAIPGAAIGFEAGNLLGEWVLMFLGLKMLAEGLVDTIPQALRLYVEAFRIAWGPVAQDRPDAPYSADYHHSEDMAAHRFAEGHVLMIIAILIALVAYLTRGKSEKALMDAIRKSERLGSKFADWLEANKGKLLEDERLKPKIRERAAGEKEPEANQAARSPSPQQRAATATPAGKVAQSTVTKTVGKNTVTWTLDANGNPISASGTLKESFSGAARSSAEVQAQADAAAAGVAGDQGGHLVGHRFVLDQGSGNLFPQEGNFNMSAFKTLENDYARYTAKGYQVDFVHTLGDFDPVTGRPGSLSVQYEVTDAGGNVVDTFSDKFLNQAGQTYTRRAF
ncbi:DUF6861 domain-containing protein [Dyella flagellata]|uniref:Uncharacterized protein n=1 Tax=Dyella flagellata TaxID=1867833 RepID=A0ABQ5XFR1_9GAMM|nr:DNA/RNA non-specific endonuclease [Dyella flagellata]GLQ89398.1 hypothetical protein GCM10007898_29710 [Dyella flagellata]